MMGEEVLHEMAAIDWMLEIEKRRAEFIRDTQAFLQIKSVFDEETRSSEAPMGEGIAKAMNFLLHKAEKEGFITKNVDGYAGHIEWGEGQELVGVLCHVDVVPEGEGWSSDPYAAEIRDGKIYARGALDDKGPTMAAFYALKIVKELGLPLKRRVRLILGTDEESDWQCVHHYFEQEEMPDMGFAPDADFPIIYAEKGIANFFLVKNKLSEVTSHAENQQSTAPISTTPIYLHSFQSGKRVNMVPDRAVASISLGETGELSYIQLIHHFEQFLQLHQLEGQSKLHGQSQQEQRLSLELEGVSAHGADPQKGINAGLSLIKFLEQFAFEAEDEQFISFLAQYFMDDVLGEKLGIAQSDEITGDLTINVGVIQYIAGEEGKLGINLRYPVSTDDKEMLDRVEQIANDSGYSIQGMDNSRPHHVDQKHPLIQTLQKVYEEQTRETATLLSIGGGTYARALQAGVAFGPLFPGKEETAHQKDEYVEIDDLIKATAIYAQAIYELATGT